MILPVRPHFIFDQVKGDRSLVMDIPDRQPGSPTLLEKFVLMAVGRIVLTCPCGNEPVRGPRIMEIGTFAGATTEALAVNFKDAQVFTLDLDHSRSRERLLQYPKVKLMAGHSMSFDFTQLYESFGLVFVDGGHDYATVDSDTMQAFSLILPKPDHAAIVWHDFGNPQFPDVERCLREDARDIYHVLDTQLAIYLRT